MAKRGNVVLICEESAIPAHRTESIGPLPIYRNDSFEVTPREADAYILFGMARRATAEEIAALDELAAFRAKVAAEADAQAQAEAVQQAALAEQAAAAELEEQRAIERAATAE